MAEMPSAPHDIVVTARGDAPPGDPLQAVNIASYRAVQSIDAALVAPVAMGYQGIVPEPVRDGLGNALRNLSEPVNFLNFLRSEEHTSELQSLMRISYAVFCLKKKKNNLKYNISKHNHISHYTRRLIVKDKA